jgi:hypothetical protein
VIQDVPSLAQILGPRRDDRVTRLQRELARLRREGGDPARDAELCKAIAAASMYDPQSPCPHGCGDVNDHRRTRAERGENRSVGDSLCPRVQRTHKKIGHWTTFRPPTAEEIERWNRTDEAEECKERKRVAKELQEAITGTER